MPMPSSEGAPKFNGRNLKEFLNDYEIGTEEAGWDERQKCTNLPLYCKRPMRDLISTFEEVISGHGWSSLKRKLSNHYHPDIYRPRYSRRDIEKYVRRKRSITKRLHFAKYYRDFMMRVKFMKPRPLSREDCNLFFWEGIPHNLQKDIYYELKLATPNMDRSAAQDIEVIHGIAMSILDRDSVYLNITHTQSKSSGFNTEDSDSTKSSKKSIKAKKKKPTKDLYDNLHSDSEEDTSSDSDSDSEDSDSDTESSDDSDDETWTHRASRNRKAKRRRSKSKERTYTKKDVIRRIAIDKTPPVDERVEQLTEEIKRLSLQLDAKNRRSPSQRNQESKREDISTNDRVDKLTEEVRNLTRRLATQDSNNNPRPNGRQTLFDPGSGRNSPGNSRYCWFCKQTDSHPPGIRNCPTCLQLLKEGLLLDSGNRITMPDGTRLPMISANSNETMDQYLRRTYAPPRDPSTPQRRTSSATLVEPHPSTYSYSGNSNWSVMDADRTEKKNVRFDPINKPDIRRTPSQGQPYVDIPPRPKSGIGPPKILPPPSTAGRHDSENELPRTKQSTFPSPPIILKRTQVPKTPLTPRPKMNNIPDEDIEMIEPQSDKQKVPEKTYAPRNPPKMQFTTDLRQKVNIHKVMDQLYEQEVKLPLGVILGISGEVSRELNNATRTHKDYVSKSPEAPKEARSIRIYEDNYISDYDSDDESEPDEVINRYTQHSKTMHMASVGELKHMLEKNLYAMGTGKLNIKINDTENIAGMIDTGSELNLISRRLQERLNLPMDPAGSYWGVKGVNGGPETLHGCCRRVPIDIGGLRFDHIFFVKNGNIGHDYDLLMGQPWLRATSAEISYGSDRPDAMRIRIYEHGNTAGDSLIINLNVDHKREATKLIQMAKLSRPYGLSQPDELQYANTHAIEYEILKSTAVNEFKELENWDHSNRQTTDYFSQTKEYWPEDNPNNYGSIGSYIDMDIDEVIAQFQTMALDEQPKPRKLPKHTLKEELHKQAWIEKEQEESIAYRVHARRQKLRNQMKHVKAQISTLGTTEEHPEAEEHLDLEEQRKEEEYFPELISLGEPVDNQYNAEFDFIIDEELWREFERMGAKPSVSAEMQDEPSIPSLGRKLSEAL
jgi:hypothetical protein